MGDSEIARDSELARRVPTQHSALVVRVAHVRGCVIGNDGTRLGAATAVGLTKGGWSSGAAKAVSLVNWGTKKGDAAASSPGERRYAAAAVASRQELLRSVCRRGWGVKGCKQENAR